MSERFQAKLRQHREAKRWSQERVALEAAVDHSLISRLERGERQPNRDNIARIVAGLGLTAAQHDELLRLAGFLPRDLGAVLTDEPTVAALYRALTDDALPTARKVRLRTLVGDALALAQGER
jgi:transcriptional regulator with XRE-family HTH domain